MDTKVALLRIHKTAGTSLADGIRRHYRDDRVCPYQFEWQYLKAKPRDLKQFSFHYPHMGPGLARHLLPEFYFITLLREPRRRLLSSYFYWRSLGLAIREGRRTIYQRLVNRKSGQYLHEVARKAADMPLDVFLASGDPVVERAMNNVQARFLAGGHYGASAEYRTQLFGIQWPPRVVEEMALAGLEQFHVVGVAEEMAATGKAVEQWLGIPIEVGMQNVTPSNAYDQDISAQAEYHIGRLTEVDERIYEVARKRLVAAL